MLFFLQIQHFKKTVSSKFHKHILPGFPYNYQKPKKHSRKRKSRSDNGEDDNIAECHNLNITIASLVIKLYYTEEREFHNYLDITTFITSKCYKRF